MWRDNYWKRAWCWGRLKAGGEGDDRGWMASPTRWTWVWVNSVRRWRSGRPGLLPSMRSQKVRHNLVTEQQRVNWMVLIYDIVCVCVCVCVHVYSVIQSCLTLCDPMDCSPPGSSVHGIIPVRILEWTAMPSSRGSSQPRDRTQSPALAGGLFTVWATWEAIYIYSIYQ